MIDKDTEIKALKDRLLELIPYEIAYDTTGIYPKAVSGGENPYTVKERIQK